MSGEQALSLLRSLLRDEKFLPDANRVLLKSLFDPESGEILDRALVTYFKAPHSFTGEDIIEISCHGSPVLLIGIIDALLLLGARAAGPGEFTLRALMNRRINLSQAEAIRDLIDARTNAAVRQAARQLNGEFSARLQPVKTALLQIIVPLESSLEFVEDDLPTGALEQAGAHLAELLRSLEELAATFRAGRLLKEGLKVTFIGRPNVGKSSLFNKLLLSDRAIVTDIPGTTRDSLSELINIEGVPVLLTDTAGIRTSHDPIESLGIERTRRAIADADLTIIVLDGSHSLTIEDKNLINEASENKNLIVLNKKDLNAFSQKFLDDENNRVEVITVSAKTGEGLDILRKSIMKRFVVEDVSDGSFLITNARHFDLLRRAAEALQFSLQTLELRKSEDLVLVGLYNALRYLDEITGETTSDDILTQIFATFCIGK